MIKNHQLWGVGRRKKPFVEGNNFCFTAMDGYYGGPGGFGSYFDPDNPEPAAEPKMQQRNAEIAYNFAPQATINARRANKGETWGEFVSPTQLTIQEEDLMIVAKSSG